MGQMDHGSGQSDQQGGVAGLASQAQEKVQETAQQATSKATQMLREQVSSRTGQATEQLHGVAEALRRTSHDLHGQGTTAPAGILDRATDGVERAATYLENTDPDRLLHDVESFGRRNPWAMIVGGLALGFVASRVLKASSGSRFQQTYPSYGQSSYQWGQPQAGGYYAGSTTSTPQAIPTTTTSV
jgi:hypothetical protein